MKKNYGLTNLLLILILLISLFIIAFGLNNSINIIEDHQILLTILIGGAVLSVTVTILISRLINENRSKQINRLNDRLALWNNISYRVKKAGEVAFNNYPIGILVISDDNLVIWSNNEAKTIFKNSLENLAIDKFNLDLANNIKKCQSQEISEFEMRIYDNEYKIQYLKEYNLIYVLNNTEYKLLSTKYSNKETVFGYIEIDNYENAFKELDIQETSNFSGQINILVTDFVKRYNGFVRALTEKRFLIVMERHDLLRMMKSNFPILEEIKNIIYKNAPLRISLSMGLAVVDDSIENVDNLASSALDQAINRGGDQVVVNIDGKKQFFGARELSEMEIDKVDIRIQSETLQSVFESRDKIFVMAHKNTDTDGFGASFALYKMAQSLDKEAYIILDSVDNTVSKILDDIENSNIELNKNIITTNEAVKRATKDSLLMVVDFQTMYQSPMDKNNMLYKKFKHVAVIDHHRQGEQVIANREYYYVRSQASSSVEIIIELLEFWGKEVEFTAHEANWLLLGIVVDTNNFLYRTSYKTFEIASILKKYGAEMDEVQRYLKTDSTEFNNKIGFYQNLTFYNNGAVVVAKAPEDKYYSRAMLAQISDSLLEIENVELSITMGYLQAGTVGLSSRSLGNINAQRIMEVMGGGGHFNNAASQISNTTMAEVNKRLIKVLAENVEYVDKIKLYFLEDVKNVAKAKEIKVFDGKMANRYLEDGVAILATVENLNLYENQNNVDKNTYIRLTKDVKELKTKLESQTIEIVVPLVNGVIYHDVTPGEIIRVINSVHGINLKAKNLQLTTPINKYGTYKLVVDLEQGFEATVNVLIKGK